MPERDIDIAFTLFSRSGIMEHALESVGYVVHSFDIQPSSRPRHHMVDLDDSDPITVAGVRPDLVVAFPPCTDLAVSGARWWRSKRDRDPAFQRRASARARLATRLGAPAIVENPVGALSTLWRSPDVVCDPCDFGGWLPPDDEGRAIYPPRDAYRKRTCLWLCHGARAPRPRPVAPAVDGCPGWAKLGGDTPRTKRLRSLTPRGMARAIADANRPPLRAIIQLPLPL